MSLQSNDTNFSWSSSIPIWVGVPKKQGIIDNFMSSFTRMLTRAFEFSAAAQTAFDDMEGYLMRGNAFETDEGTILQFDRK